LEKLSLFLANRKESLSNKKERNAATVRIGFNAGQETISHGAGEKEAAQG
jgi:hypothetical protein